eukprot:2842834-Rhodomonas_salina.1
MAAVVMAIKSAASAGSEKKKHVDKHVDVALQFISGMLDVPREDWLKAGVLQKKSRTQVNAATYLHACRAMFGTDFVYDAARACGSPWAA